MINGTIKARVVLMFLGNPSFVSGQAGVVAASLCLGVPLRCPRWNGRRGDSSTR
jgi:hypothetical protein